MGAAFGEYWITKDGWVCVQGNRDRLMPFSRLCCGCLAPTDDHYRFVSRNLYIEWRPGGVTSGPTLRVPYCQTCQGRTDRRRNHVGAFCFVGLFGSGVVLWSFSTRLGLNSSSKLALGMLLLLLAWIGIALVAQHGSEPVTIRPRFCGKGVFRIRFRNRQFTEKWAQTWGKPMDFIPAGISVEAREIT